MRQYAKFKCKRTFTQRDERKQGNQPQAPPLHVTAFIATGCPDIQVPTDVDLAYQTLSRANAPDKYE
ncbi:Target of Nesh-SH3 [Trichinella spiralis]|uniref:Target of Nesh-SH3 n=1 Tax=Trichinella spiralis TaxID=6334 RepID=A0ABR3K8T4_TRISP